MLCMTCPVLCSMPSQHWTFPTTRRSRCTLFPSQCSGCMTTQISSMPLLWAPHTSRTTCTCIYMYFLSHVDVYMYTGTCIRIMTLCNSAVAVCVYVGGLLSEISYSIYSLLSLLTILCPELSTSSHGVHRPLSGRGRGEVHSAVSSQQPERVVCMYVGTCSNYIIPLEERERER